MNSLLAIINHQPWMAQGRCVGMDPDLFFPERGETVKAAEAKRICQGCPVKRQCGEYAVQTGDVYGIWGGKSNKDRRGDRPVDPWIERSICGGWGGAKRHYANRESLCPACREFIRAESRARRGVAQVIERKPPKERRSCGTEGGATMHSRHGEERCAPCREAANEGRKARYLIRPRKPRGSRATG